MLQLGNGVNIWNFVCFGVKKSGMSVFFCVKFWAESGVDVKKMTNIRYGWYDVGASWQRTTQPGVCRREKPWNWFRKKSSDSSIWLGGFSNMIGNKLKSWFWKKVRNTGWYQFWEAEASDFEIYPNLSPAMSMSEDMFLIFALESVSRNTVPGAVLPSTIPRKQGVYWKI